MAQCFHIEIGVRRIPRGKVPAGLNHVEVVGEHPTGAWSVLFGRDARGRLDVGAAAVTTSASVEQLKLLGLRPTSEGNMWWRPTSSTRMSKRLTLALGSHGGPSGAATFRVAGLVASYFGSSSIAAPAVLVSDNSGPD